MTTKNVEEKKKGNRGRVDTVEGESDHYYQIGGGEC